VAVAAAGRCADRDEGVTGRFVQNCTLSGLGQERSRNGA
jgi:hypothetical protein